jgi:hypothetical protein
MDTLATFDRPSITDNAARPHAEQGFRPVNINPLFLISHCLSANRPKLLVSADLVPYGFTQQTVHMSVKYQFRRTILSLSLPQIKQETATNNLFGYPIWLHRTPQFR